MRGRREDDGSERVKPSAHEAAVMNPSTRSLVGLRLRSSTPHPIVLLFSVEGVLSTVPVPDFQGEGVGCS